MDSDKAHKDSAQHSRARPCQGKCSRQIGGPSGHRQLLVAWLGTPALCPHSAFYEIADQSSDRFKLESIYGTILFFSLSRLSVACLQNAFLSAACLSRISFFSVGLPISLINNATVQLRLVALQFIGCNSARTL